MKPFIDLAIEALFKAIQNGIEPKKAAKEFIEVLRKGRALRYFPLVLLKIKKFQENRLKVKEGIITTARPLSEDEKREVKNMLEKKLKKQVVLKEKIDPSLVGGATILIDDLLIDGSISGNLNRFKEAIWRKEI